MKIINNEERGKVCYCRRHVKNVDCLVFELRKGMFDYILKLWIKKSVVYNIKMLFVIEICERVVV